MKSGKVTPDWGGVCDDRQQIRVTINLPSLRSLALLERIRNREARWPGVLVLTVRTWVSQVSRPARMEVVMAHAHDGALGSVITNGNSVSCALPGRWQSLHLELDDFLLDDRVVEYFLYQSTFDVVSRQVVRPHHPLLGCPRILSFRISCKICYFLQRNKYLK